MRWSGSPETKLPVLFLGPAIIKIELSIFISDKKEDCSMPISQEVIEKHVNNITQALRNKEPKAIAQALYEFGHVLQIEYPDKDYIAIQKVLPQYQHKSQDSALSNEDITKLHATQSVITREFRDHTDEDIARRDKGDLSMFMVNHAISMGVLCFDKLLRPQVGEFEEQFKDAEMAIYRLSGSKEFSNPIAQWMRTTINSTNLSRKYHLPYLGALCKEAQQNILIYLKELVDKLPKNERQRFQDKNHVIDPIELSNTFNESDREKYKDISIAIDQYKKIEELSKCLTNPKRIESERLFDFIIACKKDETKNLLDISHLGRSFKERIKRLFTTLWEKGFFTAYTIWNQHRVAQSIQKIELEVGEIKKMSPGKM